MGTQREWLLNDWAGFLVLDGGGLWNNRLLALDGDSEAKLKFGLRSSIELFVDRRIIGIEGDECSSTVGVTFEDSFGRRWDGEEETKLFVGRDVSIQIHRGR